MHMSKFRLHATQPVIALSTALSLVVLSGNIVTQQPSWYEASSLADYTGDDIADTLRVRAFGNHVDSLRLVMTVVGLGRELFRLEWTSGGMLTDYPPDTTSTVAEREDRVRAAMRALVATNDNDVFDVDLMYGWTGGGPEWAPVGIMGSSDPRDHIAYELTFDSVLTQQVASGMDSTRAREQARAAARNGPWPTDRVRAIWKDMVERTPLWLNFSTGYENGWIVAWSNRAERFFVINRCC